jgi:hypothetical protein
VTSRRGRTLESWCMYRGIIPIAGLMYNFPRSIKGWLSHHWLFLAKKGNKPSNEIKSCWRLVLFMKFLAWGCWHHAARVINLMDYHFF